MSSYPNNNNRLNHLLICSSTQQALNNSSPNMNLYSTNTDNLISRANQQLRTSELQTNDTMNINEEQFYSLDTNEFPSNAYLNDQQNSRLGFCNWYLEQLRSQVNNVAGYLPQDMPIEYQSFMQDCQKKPQNSLSPLGFNMFLSTIQHGQQLSKIPSQDSAMGEESYEMSNQYTSAPFDENVDHTPEQIQTLTQSDPTMSHISENDSLPEPALNLTKLLLEQLEIIKGEVLTNLKFIHRPKPLWHARTTKCLAKNECAPLQSTTERQLIVLEWSNLTNLNENNLFIHVKLLGYDDKTHPLKFIVPPETPVGDLDKQLLSINRGYGYNLINKTILFPLTKVKHPDYSNQIILPVFMFNSIKSTKDKQSSNADEIDLNFVKSEMKKICKLRIEMCRLTNGVLESICEYIDTNLIKESKSTKELEIIPVDDSKITPKNPCECGHEDISVLLNTNSEKAGFIVIIDGRRLKIHEFNGVTNNKITIHPPPKTTEGNNFHLIIKKINVLKTLEQNLNPLDLNNLKKDPLLDISVEYRNHNGHCSHVNQKKKSRKE